MHKTQSVKYLVGAVLLISLVRTLQARRIPRPQRDSVAKAELTRIADDWDKAIVAKDTAAIANNMAQDFRQINSSGEVKTKSSFVKDLTSENISIDPYTVDDLDVRIYGDVALLSGTTRMTGREEGRPFKSHYRYIDIYVKVNGGWKIVSVQTTSIST
jgi:ketosteroid isomerase-like protein